MEESELRPLAAAVFSLCATLQNLEVYDGNSYAYGPFELRPARKPDAPAKVRRRDGSMVERPQRDTLWKEFL